MLALLSALLLAAAPAPSGTPARARFVFAWRGVPKLLCSRILL